MKQFKTILIGLVLVSVFALALIYFQKTEKPEDRTEVPTSIEESIEDSVEEPTTESGQMVQESMEEELAQEPSGVRYEIERQEARKARLIRVGEGEKKVLIENLWDFIPDPGGVDGWGVYSSFENTIILKGLAGGIYGLFKISLSPLQGERIQNKPGGDNISPSGRYVLSATTSSYLGQGAHRGDFMEDLNELRKIWMYDLLKDTETVALELPKEESLTEGFEYVPHLPLIGFRYTLEWQDDNTIRYQVFSTEQEVIRPAFDAFEKVGDHSPLRPLLEIRTFDLSETIE